MYNRAHRLLGIPCTWSERLYVLWRRFIASAYWLRPSRWSFYGRWEWHVGDPEWPSLPHMIFRIEKDLDENIFLTILWHDFKCIRWVDSRGPDPFDVVEGLWGDG